MKDEHMCNLEQLQAYADHKLTQALQEKTERHLVSCELCRNKLAEIQDLEEWVIQKYSTLRPTDVPSLSSAALFHQLELEEKQQAVEDSFFWRWWRLTGLMTAMSVMAFWFVASSDPSFWNKLWGDSNSNAPEFLAKGWEAKMFYGRRLGPKTYAKTKVVKGNTTLYPFDTIQFSYTFSTKCFVAVVGINQEGKAFPLVLSKLKFSQKMSAGSGTFPASRSFLLDRYVGKERYFVVVSAKKFSWKTLESKIVAGWKLNKKSLKRFPRLVGPWLIRTWLITKKLR